MKKVLAVLFLILVVSVSLAVVLTDTDLYQENVAYADSSDDVLPADWKSNFYNLTGVYPSSIKSIIFASGIPAGYTDQWLISAEYVTRKFSASSSISICHKSDDTNCIAFVSANTILAPVEKTYSYGEEAGLFSSLTVCQSFDFSNFSTANSVSMNNMFAECEELVSLSVTFDTSNVTEMAAFCYRCKKLESIDFGTGFDTSKVTDMQAFFAGCKKLTSINYGSGFTTENVEDMSGFFSGLPLASIEVPFNTSKVKNMTGLFADCINLTSVSYGPDFTTENVENLSSLFAACPSLTAVDLTRYNTHKVTTIYGMFSGDTLLTEITYGQDFDTSKVIDFAELFACCEAMTNIDISKYDTSSAISLNYMFALCTKLESITYGPYFDTSNVTGMEHLFMDDISLVSLDVSMYHNTLCENFEGVFSGCTSLQSIVFSDDFLTEKAKYCHHMFEDCSSLTAVNVSDFNTINIMMFDSMFDGCSSLSEIDISNFILQNCSMDGMFSGCEALTTITFPSSSTNIKSIYSVFENCKAIENINLAGLDINSNDLKYMFKGCSSLEEVNFGNAFKNTTSIDYMDEMFDGCAKLQSIDLSCFTGKAPSYVDGMFNGCTSLTELDLSGMDFSRVTARATGYDVYMFDDSAIYSIKAPYGIGSAKLHLYTDFAMYDIVHYSKYYCSKDSSTNNEVITSSNCSTISVPVVFNKMCYVHYVYDDNTSIGYNFIPYGSEPELSTDPVKPADDTYYYTFDGWAPAEIVNRNKTYTAVYTSNRYELPSDWKTQYNTLTSQNYVNITSLQLVSAAPAGYVNAWPSAEAYLGPEDFISLYHKDGDFNQVAFVSSKTIYAPVNSNKLFYYLQKLTNITFGNFNTEFVTDMSEMFKFTGDEFVAEIRTLNLSSFNTSNVVDMSEMFAGIGFQIVDIAVFDFSNVTNMSSMFAYSVVNESSNILKEIKLSNELLASVNVVSFENLFGNCCNLETVDLSKILVASATNVTGMFKNCAKLTTIDISHFYLNNCTSLENLFKGCSALTSVKLPNLKNAEIQSLNGIFSGCASLKTIDVSKINFSAVTNMCNMFYECTDLESIVFDESIDTSNVVDFSCTFAFCESLEFIPMAEHFDTNSAVSLAGTFAGCSKLKSIDVTGYDTSNVEAFGALIIGMFMNCSSLEEIDVSNFNTSKCTMFSMMFMGCEKLKSIDVSNFDTSNAQYITAMFAMCSSLEEIDVSNFDTSKAVGIQSMFAYCTSLKELDISNFDLGLSVGGGDNFLVGTNPYIIYAPQNMQANFILNTAYYHYTIDCVNGEVSRSACEPETTTTILIGKSSVYTNENNYSKSVFSKKMTISWINYDGEELSKSYVLYGDTPSTVLIPTKPSSEKADFGFIGWSPEIVPAKANATYTAVYKTLYYNLKVTWKNFDGTEICKTEIEYGTVPVFTGTTPVKNPTTELVFAFTGWTPALTNIYDDAEYTAVFSSETRKYSVKWMNDGVLIKEDFIEYGKTPSYTYVVPEKTPTPELTYSFNGWTPAIAVVNTDAVYNAVFTSSDRYYSIKWVSEDKVLQEDLLKYNEIPNYVGDTPSKAENRKYTYEFIGWDKAVTNVTGDCTYTATFKELEKETVIPLWVYIVVGVSLVLAILGIIIGILLRRKKAVIVAAAVSDDEEKEEESPDSEETDIKEQEETAEEPSEEQEDLDKAAEDMSEVEMIALIETMKSSIDEEIDNEDLDQEEPKTILDEFFEKIAESEQETNDVSEDNTQSAGDSIVGIENSGTDNAEIEPEKPSRFEHLPELIDAVFNGKVQISRKSLLKIGLALIDLYPKYDKPGDRKYLKASIIRIVHAMNLLH